MSAISLRFLVLPVVVICSLAGSLDAAPDQPAGSAELFPLGSVRITGGPFAEAMQANRRYLLAHDPDRLLAPFLREAGLKPKAASYGNWEDTGLDGHTAGHYLSALALMIASGSETPEGELSKRLDYMVAELDRCQAEAGNGYIGGVPGGMAMWDEVAAGKIRAHGFGLNDKWVPLYNIHKTFAGLRDAYREAGREKAKDILIRYGDWVAALVSKLSDEQVQDMLTSEHGGMNEVLADLFAITGDRKYLDLAKRFNHHAILDPLIRRRDELTGKHANTQIPKVIGLERIATLDHDEQADAGAEFFWQTVTRKRSVAFGGNSVSEHFNDPQDFRGVLEHREGPETCNTYNMLRLTEQLFEHHPKPEYADYYERALYNHILSAIDPENPGYVYFTPLRPAHYRVYSQPEQAFWCCVGSGMENPGKYGRFIYANAGDDLYVNLFIPSVLETPTGGLTLTQETKFPFEEWSRLTLALPRPKSFTLHLRHPQWVAAGDFAVRVNGELVSTGSDPGTYAAIRREWREGDVVELSLPMRTRVEGLPDGSDWYAILHGPILLAAPSGKDHLDGMRAGPGRNEHIAHGALVPLDQVPALATTPDELAGHVVPDPDAGPLHFRIKDVVVPDSGQGLTLRPFFSLHAQRYQMYWNILSKEELASRREDLARTEKLRQEREKLTLDSVGIGEQQPEVEHGFKGEETRTGEFRGRRYRDGKAFQYTLDTRGESAAVIEVGYWGGDRDREFEILANGRVIARVALDASHPEEFITRRYEVPAEILRTARKGHLVIRFQATKWVAGGIYELRLMRAGK